MSLDASAWLQERFPFLWAYWPWTVSTVLLVVLVHLVLERRRGWHTETAAKPGWHDESVSAVSGEEEAAGPPPAGPLSRVPYSMEAVSPEEMVRRSEQFYGQLNSRRSVRHFSGEPVPRAAVENAIRAAGTSPSGAHTQPWTFVLVSSADMKAAVRHIVEQEEEVNYQRRMGDKWVRDLVPLATNWQKEYLTTVPYLVLVFRHAYGLHPDGTRYTTYYNEISCHMACGLLVAALHSAGLATLTSTPLNCGPRLRRLLGRPEHEKLVLLLPVGRPSADCTVPDLSRKPLTEIMAEV